MSGTRIGVLVASSLLGLLAAFGIFLPTAFAQTTGLQIKPAIIEANVKPGDTYNFNITVTNISSDAQTFAVGTKDISGLDDSGKPIFAPAGQETSYSLSTWIPTPSQPITLQAGES